MTFKPNRILLLGFLAAITACGDGLMQMTSERQLSLAGETITVLKGNAQVGVAGLALPKPIIFVVKNSGGTALGGATGTITVTAGGGSTSKTTFKTNSTGKISFNWTLGATGPQTVTMALTGGTPSTIATATVIPLASTFTILSGNNQSATVGDTLALPVRVELKDPSNNPIAGATITYSIQDGSGGGVRTNTAKTSAVGRVSNFWALGWNKKPQKLVAKIVGLDSVVFDAMATTTGITLSVNAGNNQVGSPNTALPTQLRIELLKNGLALPKGKGTFVVRNGGGSVSSAAFVTNSNGRASTTWTLGPSGTQRVKAIIGAVDSVTFNATFAVACTPLTIGVGETQVVSTSSLCLSGGVSGQEYVVIPTNQSGGTVIFDLTATNIGPLTQLPTPNIVPGMKTLAMSETADQMRKAADDWEWKFREQEASAVRSIPRKLSPAFGADAAIVPGVPIVGAKMKLNVSSTGGTAACTDSIMRTGIVRHVSAHLILMEDSVNPTAHAFTAGDWADIATEFENVVWGPVTGNFGTPNDMDGNGRVIALYTTAVNALTPPMNSSYTGGFFFGRDLFPKISCPGSNVGEMFYMLAPDSAGSINGNIRGPGFVKRVTVGTIAHELQHLINASRRLALNSAAPFEQVWLNEGLSHIAEELVYYAKSGRTPGQNIGAAQIFASQLQLDAYLQFMNSNFNRLVSWWANSEFSGPFANNDQLLTRGSIWWFLRYAADRRGGTQSTFWNALAGTTETGLTNLQNRLGTDPMPWFRDWAGMNYTDDLAGATGTSINGSWNWRNMLTDAYGAPYPLVTRTPTANNTLGIGLGLNGSASYMTFRVNGGTNSSVTITPPSSTQRVLLFRRN